MDYDWNRPADETPKMDEGYHRATVTKLVHTKKVNGTDVDLEDKNGDRFIIVIFANYNGEESTKTVWVEGGQEGSLRALVQNLDSFDLAKLQGHKPDDFLDAAWAKKMLIGRTCWVSVTHRGKYANGEPIKEADGPASALQREKAERPAASLAGAAQEDDIPF